MPTRLMRSGWELPLGLALAPKVVFDYLMKRTWLLIFSLPLYARGSGPCSARTGCCPWYRVEMISGPTAARFTQEVSGMPRSCHSARSISSTWVAASTAPNRPGTQHAPPCSPGSRWWFPAHATFADNQLHAGCSMNCFSGFSMRMLVVGPMETISKLPSSFFLDDGACRGRLRRHAGQPAVRGPVRSRRRCATVTAGHQLAGEVVDDVTDVEAGPGLPSLIGVAFQDLFHGTSPFVAERMS